ncbi:hypothetical protein AAMO2058_001246100 [Amorphochlora amoebiformis]
MPSLRNKPRVKRKLLKDRREREKMKASSRVVTQGNMMMLSLEGCIHEYTDGVESKSVEQNEVNAASANQNDNGWQEIPDSDSKTNQSKRPIDFNSHDKILSERMDPKTQLPVNPISLKGLQLPKAFLREVDFGYGGHFTVCYPCEKDARWILYSSQWMQPKYNPNLVTNPTATVIHHSRWKIIKVSNPTLLGVLLAQVLH